MGLAENRMMIVATKEMSPSVRSLNPEPGEQPGTARATISGSREARHAMARSAIGRSPARQGSARNAAGAGCDRRRPVPGRGRDSVPRMRVALCVLVAASLLVPGCANLAVGPSSPRPNVMVGPEVVPADLVLDPAIPDNFVIPATASVNQVPVRSWRQTLNTGYHSAFPLPGSSGRQMQLLAAELSFAPAAVSMHGTAAVVASIRFKARLVDSSGAEVGKAGRDGRGTRGQRDSVGAGDDRQRDEGRRGAVREAGGRAAAEELSRAGGAAQATARSAIGLSPAAARPWRQRTRWARILCFLEYTVLRLICISTAISSASMPRR